MGKLLVLDIGGTYIKYGLADGSGALLPDSVRQTPSCAEGSAEDFLGILRRILEEAQRHDTLQGACACIAGPFDFYCGVSLMKHKFQGLYGRSLRPPFEEKGVAVSFLHDSTAFMLGEYGDGSLQGESNACCVMLGTGLGFAWIREGKVCVDKNQAPALALWKTPYLDGIAEDYVSTRALQRYYGEAISIKEMAGLARSGNERAREAFLTAGHHLSLMMTEIIEKLGCAKFALGGQIAKSADLFRLRLPVPWAVTKHPDDAALLGVCRYAALGKENCVRVEPLDFGPLKGKDRQAL